MILLTLVALLLAAPAAFAARAHVSLHLGGSRPVVHGRAFHAHERVTLHVHPGRGKAFTRHLRAGAKGTFAAALTGLTSPPCGNFRLSATGSLGSRASLTGLMFPGCLIG